MSQTLSNPPQGGIVPTGDCQFFLESGAPNASGKVYMYLAGTTILATTWQDAALTTPNTNPIVLDAGGRAKIWGLGNYTQTVQDSAGNQIWSAEVSANITFLTLTDTGTANTYVASVPGLVSSGLTNLLAQVSGIQLFLVPANSNTGASTLNLSGLGATPIVYPNGSALIGGELPAGALIPMVYNATSGKFQLLSTTLSPGAPIPGEIRALGGPSVPTGWLLCYGQAVSRTTYSNTFAQIGTSWGAGDGSTTFNLPDLRGRGLFGADAMGGSAAGRLTSASLGTGVSALVGVVGGNENTQQHTHTLNDPSHYHNEVSVQQIRAAGTGNYWNAVVDGATASSGGAGTNPGVTGTAGIATADTGITIAAFGSGASQNLPPAAVVNWIIAAS